MEMQSVKVVGRWASAIDRLLALSAITTSFVTVSVVSILSIGLIDQWGNDEDAGWAVLSFLAAPFVVFGLIAGYCLNHVVLRLASEQRVAKVWERFSHFGLAMNAITAVVLAAWTIVVVYRSRGVDS